jgi:hypothetical protein
MSSFLRFTLFVAALCAAAVVGYIAGVRNAGPAAPPDQRMTIDAHGSSGSRTARATTPPDAPAPEPRPAVAAPQAGAQNAEDEAAPPTSIDEILRRQASQPPPAN